MHKKAIRAMPDPPGQAASFQPFEKTIPELTHAMQAGQLTSVQLVQYYLGRIKAYDGILRAFITINPNVLKEAQTLDTMRSRGKILGPLHGIPIVLKDNFNTTDMPTTGASIALATMQPKKDAFLVKKLREAGAVFLGKTNLTELASGGTTISALGGQTLNPYDPLRAPGGSSGGSAAAVAANFAAGGTGSDTVNSVRSPASATALVGLRPSRGLLSRSGIIPNSEFQDMPGTLTRTVADAAVMLTAMAGRDPADGSTSVIADKALPDYAKALKNDGLQKKKIALLTTCLGKDPAVTGVVRRAVKDIETLGAVVVEADLPQLETSALTKDNDVQRWEQKRELDAYFSDPSSGSPVKSLEELVTDGRLTPSVQTRMIQRLTMEDPRQDPAYRATLEKNNALGAFIQTYMRDNGIDAFLYPHQSVLTATISDAALQPERNGIIASVTGLPAITLPGGFSEPTPTAVIGVPVGIEFLGLPFSEETLLCMAYAYEQGTKHRKAPASMPDLDLSSA